MTKPTDQQWLDAQHQFESDPHRVKVTADGITFYHIQDQLVADTGAPVYRGFFSKVKQVINRDGHPLSLKILPVTDVGQVPFSQRFNSVVMQLIGFLKAIIQRVLPKTDKKPEREKVYALTEYHPGHSLKEMMQSEKLSYEQQCLIALASCMAVHRFHQQFRAIHGDINPGNIIINWLSNGMIEAKLIDFDFSVILPIGQDEVKVDGVLSMVEYAAPELCGKNRRSFATDVYALGITLRELGLSALAEKMTLPCAKSRSSMSEVIFELLRYISLNEQAAKNRTLIEKAMECINGDIHFDHMNIKSVDELIHYFRQTQPIFHILAALNVGPSDNNQNKQQHGQYANLTLGAAPAPLSPIREITNQMTTVALKTPPGSPPKGNTGQKSPPHSPTRIKTGHSPHSARQRAGTHPPVLKI